MKRVTVALLLSVDTVPLVGTPCVSRFREKSIGSSILCCCCHSTICCAVLRMGRTVNLLFGCALSRWKTREQGCKCTVEYVQRLKRISRSFHPPSTCKGQAKMRGKLCVSDNEEREMRTAS